MEPKNNLVLVEPISRNEAANQEVQIAGFEIRRAKEAPPQQGYVRFISPRIESPQYEVGDRVIFNNAFPGFHFNDVGYLPVEHENIIGVIK